eukprot:7328876-Pyramimonas_sp.AAC.1
MPVHPADDGAALLEGSAESEGFDGRPPLVQDPAQSNRTSPRRHRMPCSPSRGPQAPVVGPRVGRGD